MRGTKKTNHLIIFVLVLFLTVGFYSCGKIQLSSMKNISPTIETNNTQSDLPKDDILPQIDATFKQAFLNRVANHEFIGLTGDKREHFSFIKVDWRLNIENSSFDLKSNEWLGTCLYRLFFTQDPSTKAMIINIYKLKKVVFSLIINDDGSLTLNRNQEKSNFVLYPINFKNDDTRIYRSFQERPGVL